MKIAIRDDYENVALKLTGWSAVARSAEIIELLGGHGR
jgi:hypothetical protein